MRLVNPKDQSYVRSVMENLPESDERLLPGFGPGQGIISGQAVRFPLLGPADEVLVHFGRGKFLFSISAAMTTLRRARSCRS